MKVKIKITAGDVEVAGKPVAAGTVVELDQVEAANLLTGGKAEPLPDAEPATPPKAPKKENP